MVNYENSKIYKIVCNVTGLCYIGSTTLKLSQRLSKHKNNYKRYKNGKCHNVTSFKVLENDDYDIILLEKVQNCTSKEELYARERYYIENNDCVNRCIVGRTQKEYYEDNKEKIQAYKSEKHLCPCGGCYTTDHISHHMKTVKHKKYVQLETLKDCLKKNLSYSETKKVLEAL
jgi:hypothetical protein